MEIRDTRNGDWHWVNNAVIACQSITHSDKSVYSALTTFSNCQEIRPSFEELAKRSNTSIRAAKNSVKRLIKAGYLNVENIGKKGLSNIYFLLKAVEGCKKCNICTSQKKGKFEQEEGQIDVRRRANFAPQIRKGIKEEHTREISKNEISSVSSPLHDDIYIPPSEEEVNEEERREAAGAAGARVPRKKDKIIWAICLWYLKESQDIRKTKEDYISGGYFSALKVAKERGTEELKKILKFYIDSEKFDRHPRLTAALSADSLRIYAES